MDNIENKYLLRQVFVSSAMWTSCFIQGLALGAPAVFIPQIRIEANSSDIISMEMESWLSSAVPCATLPWMILLPYLANKYGRRVPQILVSVIFIGSFTFYYLSRTPLEILICEVMLGCTGGLSLTVSLMIATECSSPRYRGIFLTLKSASLYWGIWVSNALGTVFYYKVIPAFSIVCSVYMLLVSFWCESPYWLASKGRFEESIKFHRWLKGRNQDSERELASMLLEQKTEYKRSRNKEQAKIDYETIKSKEFYMPCLLGLLVMILYSCSGKMACSVYSIQIVKKITLNESMAYKGMLILDGFSVFSTYAGSVLSRYINRRTLLFSSSWLGITFLFILSLYLYLIKLSIITENPIITIGILALFSVSISAGVAILSNSLLGEIMPFKYKSSTTCIASLSGNAVFASVLKITPYLLKKLGTHGAFLTFAVSASFATILLQVYLPETKGKTIQDIEKCFKKKSVEEVELVSLKNIQ